MTFTFEEMEKSLIALRDNQVVQGQILNRVEQAVERNTEAIARNTEAIAKIADGFILLQAAMKGMAEAVERFVKGLDHNGHRGTA